jgi:hypothetical protein
MAKRSSAAKVDLMSRAAAPNLFLWGVGGLALSLLVVFGFPAISQLQAVVLASLTGLSGAAIATAIPGILRIKLKAVAASGALVVFFLVFSAVVAAGAPDAFPTWLLGRVRVP